MVALGTITPEAAAVPLAPGKWSVQQIVGHLCDSAMNNHQRLVRLQLQPILDSPGYEQDGWVRTQRYDLLPWSDVLNLWLTLNRHFAHSIRFADPATLTHVWRNEGSELTLGFILEDYLGHLEHHLRILGIGTVV